ncbi:hypothetical protein BJ322DRAFT_845184 [Thelephora terrestris]|uniref:Uncharacterized protein n=1 Tax=Thelephora terrestris TaxID=56493 RepID=A0A9P6HFL6_9AGAM|nr:hypothetical protein BJ322DRAFT_845184 [Thelephora terrestris]
MFKIVAPAAFVILASVFATLNARLHLPPLSPFLIALTLTDVIDSHDRHFLFPSYGHGVVGWRLPGQSIIFFSITSLLVVWSAGICTLGEGLMAVTLVEYHRRRRVAVRKDD